MGFPLSTESLEVVVVVVFVVVVVVVFFVFHLPRPIR